MQPSSLHLTAETGASSTEGVFDYSLPQKTLKDVMYSSQRQVNTITIDSADRSEPHILTLETTAVLRGQVLIDGEVVATLESGSTSLDIAPYLRDREAISLEVMGTYTPGTAMLRMQFSGPGISISQQSSGIGRLQYQLNLMVQ
jgi:hypothetical protein